MRKITLKELAKKLNLSVSTVSKSLNDSYEISEATKAKVRAYAQQLNYSPNLQAKSLKLGKSNSIGVIISTIGSTFQAQIMEAMHFHATEAGYNLVMMQSQDSEALEAQALHTLINHGVEGIIISPAFENSNQPLLQHIHAHICPVIIFDRIKYDLDTYKIGVNNRKAVYHATQELIRIHRTNIVLICGKHIGVTQDRIDGFKKALKDYHIEFNEKDIIYCSYQKTLEEIDDMLACTFNQLAKNGSLPNAILGTTDMLTTRVLGVLAKLKIKVPEEIAIIGFSNTSIPYSLNPPLSTIEQPIHAMAQSAMEKLLLYIKKPNEVHPEEVLLDSTITLRESTQVPL